MEKYGPILIFQKKFTHLTYISRNWCKCSCFCIILTRRSWNIIIFSICYGRHRSRCWNCFTQKNSTWLNSSWRRTYYVIFIYSGTNLHPSNPCPDHFFGTSVNVATFPSRRIFTLTFRFWLFCTNCPMSAKDLKFVTFWVPNSMNIL